LALRVAAVPCPAYSPVVKKELLAGTSGFRRGPESPRERDEVPRHGTHGGGRESVADVPSAETTGAPGTIVSPQSWTTKVLEVTVRGSTGSLKAAVTLAVTGTLTAPSGGSMPVTVGKPTPTR